MKADSIILQLFIGLIALCLINTTQAGSPLWTFTPLTATTISVSSGSTATVQYLVTNQSRKTHSLVMQPIPGMTQQTTGLGICGNPFTLVGKASCTLSISINGSQLPGSVSNGPLVCEQNSALQCYRPSAADILRITKTAPVSTVTISTSGSPLTLTENGMSGIIVINNSSLTESATNIVSDFTGTALDGNVTETGNTCANVPPQASCTLTYTPGGTAVPLTNFSIQGSNTNVVSAEIQIDSGVSLTGINPTSGVAAGGVGVTLTGSGLTGTTGVTFDGVAAANVNVVNSTTVTAVTPAHAIGAVDVVITTPSGSSTLIGGFTYVPTAVGPLAFGGVIACLNGGSNNLIASIADNSAAVEWGGVGIATNATSNTDGATNTATIVAALGANGGTPYAAQICSNYEVDSQGNTPCEAGNTCYDDWFLPAGNNVAGSGQLNCLYTNAVAIGGFAGANYASSTENAANFAWVQSLLNGAQSTDAKSANQRVRCVRAFTP